MSRIIDLTMRIEEGMPGLPSHGRTPVLLSGTLNHWEYKNQSRFSPYGGELVSFENEQWVLNGHTGTHMDAVFHANPASEFTIDTMPLERCIGSAILLDCAFAKSPQGEITSDILAEAEQRSADVVGRGDIVVVNTGCGRDLTSPQAYLDDHMGLTQEAGEWLRAIGIRALAIDSPSPETVGNALTAPVHMNFLRPESLGLAEDAYIPIIENVCNLDSIPVSRFQFIALPLPLRGGSGSPVRAVALVDQ